MNTELEALLARMHHTDLNAIDLGLERVERFLALLGSPQKRLPPVVHVAGTNGKGSLIACLDAIFKAAGLKVHRYVSPHLVRFNERIQIAGEPITDAYLQELLTRVAAFIDHQPVTFFESTTAAAFLAFSEHPADVVLLETGMGGRLDATNVVEKPALTAITPISRDHTQFLGDTPAAIAAEKAGIIKAGVTCVVGKQEKEALEVIRHKAKEMNAPLYLYWKDWKPVLDGASAKYRSGRLTMQFSPSLAGKHQYDNAATAIACVEKLPQFNITAEHIADGIAQARWPARLQHLAWGPLAKILHEGIELWLDGGHNPQGGEVLAQWFAGLGVPVYLVCGMMQGKESAAFLKPMRPFVNTLYAVAIEGEAQSQSPEQLLLAAQEVGIRAEAAESVEKALQTIAAHARTASIVCICGSLYLAGKVLALNGE